MSTSNSVTPNQTNPAGALHRAGARRIAVEDPCFAPHRDAVALTGLQPVPIPVDAHGIDVARLADHDIAAVLLAPAHSFPTARRSRPAAAGRCSPALVLGYATLDETAIRRTIAILAQALDEARRP